MNILETPELKAHLLCRCAARYLRMTAVTLLLSVAAVTSTTAPAAAANEPVTVAVASNFAPATRDLAAEFEQQTGTSIRISSASTGKLYAQITNGAPFDVFLAADTRRPQLLEDSGHAVANSRTTYAFGRLILWSRDPDLANGDCRAHLAALGSKRLAIANPATAPYGAAAQQVLINIDAWNAVEPRLVTGENVSQTLQYVSSGNASLGFIAATQALDDRLPAATCSWQVPPELHQPIEQQAVLLNRSIAHAKNPAAKAFLEFLHSPVGTAIIEQHGYLLPH
jgi:molybdate transport system substrate-binding protein